MPDGIAAVKEMMCGCGDHEAVWTTVRDYLEACGRPIDQRSRLSVDALDGRDWLFLYVMDHCGLTEHGSGIYFAWLTDAGKAALAFLVEHGTAWDYWVDGVTQVEFYDKDGTWLNNP